MRVYIDEAGSFVMPQGRQSSFSLVLALIVPSASEEKLFYQFLRLRDGWPKQEIEIKGSSLDETQSAQVIDLLSRFDVLVEFVALDMATHPKEVIDDFKLRQAEAITAHVTREHHPDMVLHLEQISRTIRDMPNQLFVQAESTIQLILEVIRIATLYYVQRQPKELGDIAWIVDRKNHTLTEMEETWTTLILPMSESHFVRTPLVALVEADYSHFARYEVDPAADEEIARHLDWMRATFGDRESRRKGRVIDAKRLLSEQQKFADSRDSLGLQLADMLASILRRALNNRIKPPGWKDFGKLVVHNPKPEWFVQLGGGDVRRPLQGTALSVYRALEAGSKSMVNEASFASNSKPRIKPS
jgi:uncharacterized protein DUF3800